MSVAWLFLFGWASPGWRTPSALLRLGAVILLVAVATTQSSLGTPTTRSGLRFTPVQPWPRGLLPLSSITEQLPPPPSAVAAHYRQFIHLYASYTVLTDKKPSFAQWLIMHGVVDPTTHQAMMLLYGWATRNSL